MTGPSSQAPADLEWLSDVLWPGRTTRIARSCHPGAECYGIIGRRQPRFLVPAGAHVAAVACLLAYNKLRPPRVRAARWMASALLRARVTGWPTFAGCLQIDGLHDDVAMNDSLSEIFGRDDLAVGIGIPPRGPNRKPVLQVFSRSGEPIGYVKVGWNEITRRRVGAESEALQSWNRRRGRATDVPRLVYGGEWRGLQISATSPLPADARRYRSHQVPVDALRDVLDLAPRSIAPLSAYLTRLQQRVEPLVDSDELAAAARALLDRVVDRDSSTTVEVGVSHGDWVPWNLATRSGRVYVFDWEHWANDVPVGVDLLYWHFQVAFVLKHKSVEASIDHAVESARRDAGRLGVSVDLVPLLARLLLVELALRAAEGVAAGAPENPRFHTPAVPVLTACLSDRFPA